MVKSARSAVKGSGYDPPGLYPDATRVTPPSHAGIVPAAFAAFSAPIGESVLPSLATSAAESSAAAGMARAAPTASAAQDVFEFTDMSVLLVVILDESRA